MASANRCRKTFPEGPFYMELPLYGLDEAALSGEWMQPQAVKIKHPKVAAEVEF
jgi:hypothetical protein